MLLAVVIGVVLSTAFASKGPADWYYKYWCGTDANFKYLLDADCAKMFPPVVDREWTCPVPIVSSVPEGFQINAPLSEAKIDTTTLQSVITPQSNFDLNMCLVMIKRVQNASAELGYTIYNKYYCYGDSATQGFETWSSSKIFAMANAAGHLRTNESQCGNGNAQNLQFGLDGQVTGKHGLTPYGDLATIVCSYDTTAGYTSNSLSSYFHDFGWRDRINDVVLQSWLGVTKNQTLGGNYGEATPSDLQYTVTSANNMECIADKDLWLTKYDNTITALTATEMTRRIALFREMPENMKFPGATWRDMQNILYGAEKSVLFPGQLWGGMSADIGVFTQYSANVADLLKAADAHNVAWRIFSKLGDGWSSSRYRGEIVSNNYACIPTFDVEGKQTAGYEFTLTARGSVPNDASIKVVEKDIFNAINQAITFIISQHP